MKNIGKPCAGEPHARFDEGGQGETCSLLYPEFRERVLPEGVRSRMRQAYETAEAKTPGLEEKYRQLVEQYEQQTAILTDKN